MDFTSAAFFLFFPLAALLHGLAPRPLRRPLLLAFSYLFYLSFVPLHALLLAASTAVDFALARRLAAAAATGRRRWLLAGLAHNILLLAGCKYLGFLAAILAPLQLLPAPEALAFIAPVGVSYFTFKKISYLIDVQRGAPAEGSFLSFALHVAFFPSLMAGPIDRAGSLLPQLGRPAVLTGPAVASGLQLMAWGLFKKLVIADRLAPYVARVYDQPGEASGPALAAATLYFSIQIYCDFSGYTDIARGSARVLGIELAENFRRPYFATSIAEFWRRWHMTLSRWLMDYVFLPVAYAVSRRLRAPRLLGVRAESWSYLVAIGLTMGLCGLWHGASWTFVVWGGLHGLLLGASFASRRLRRRLLGWSGLRRRPRLHAVLAATWTFALVSLAWIFFRAASLNDALAVLAGLGRGWDALLRPADLPALLSVGLLKRELAVGLAAALLLLLADGLRGQAPLEAWTAARRPPLRWGIYLLLLLAVLTFAETASESFIYFRF